MQLRVRLLRLFLLFFGTVFFCTPGGTLQLQTKSAAPETTDLKVRKIQAEAKRIDAASDEPDNGKTRHVSVDFANWQFSGFFDGADPLSLNAIFTEGQVVREETYYFVMGEPLLVRVSRWWDVEDGSKAPEAATDQDFYLEKSRIIRRVIKTGSSSKTRTVEGSGPAPAFRERANQIVKILADHNHDGRVPEALQQFPEAELPEN